MTEHDVVVNTNECTVRAIKAGGFLLAWLILNVTSCNMYGYYLDRDHPKAPSMHELNNVGDRDEWAYELRLKELQLETYKLNIQRNRPIFINDKDSDR